MLIMALGRTLPTKDFVASGCFWSLHTTAVIGAAYFGANDKEAGLIAMPFAWLTGNSLWILMHCVGLEDLQLRLGVAEAVGKWYRNASLTLFISVQVWLYGIKNEFVTVTVLWQAIGLIYEQLG
jgi:hypothetical protein